MLNNLENDTYLRLREVLTNRAKVRIVNMDRKPSAVLVPIYYQQGQYYIIFTRRTELVHHHKGEISFPGGGYHSKDGTLLNTALRESFEEIGLAPTDVEVLGELDDGLTRGSPYIITPFVGAILPDYHFKMSDFETAEIIHIPIKSLIEKGCRWDETEIVLAGRPVIPCVYTYKGNVITGATARILKQFLDIFIQVS